MTQQKILLVDDEPKLVAVVRDYLEHDGYGVITAQDGPEALERFRTCRPDMVVLDLMLPRVDGLEVCRRLRRESNVPIIMLTARAEERDEQVGLELGADDYVTKPFSPRTLLARIHALFRRVAKADDADEAPLIAGPLRVDLARHGALWAEKILMLTPTEFHLLAVLARRPGRVFERGELLDQIQGVTSSAYERTVDAHIKNLRKKLAMAGGGEASAIVATVPGVGYTLKAPDA